MPARDLQSSSTKSQQTADVDIGTGQISAAQGDQALRLILADAKASKTVDFQALATKAVNGPALEVLSNGPVKRALAVSLAQVFEAYHGSKLTRDAAMTVIEGDVKKAIATQQAQSQARESYHASEVDADMQTPHPSLAQRKDQAEDAIANGMTTVLDHTAAPVLGFLSHMLDKVMDLGS